MSIDSPIKRTSSQACCGCRLRHPTLCSHCQVSSFYVASSLLCKTQCDQLHACDVEHIDFNMDTRTRVCCPRACKKHVNCFTNAQLCYKKPFSLGPGLLSLFYTFHRSLASSCSEIQTQIEAFSSIFPTKCLWSEEPMYVGFGGWRDAREGTWMNV